MQLHVTWQKIDVGMSATRGCHADELLARVRLCSPPYWLSVEGTFIRLSSRGELWVACQAVAAEHNAIAYNVPEDDGFAQEIADIEARVQAHLEDPAESEDSGDSVSSSEDMVYERCVYI
jgi:hypothetical protein